jgi:perosamine synthetase
MYTVELDESTGWDAKKMMESLFSRGVETRPFFIGLHEQPALLDKGLYQDGQFPVTHKSSKQGFYLPSSMNLTDTQIKFVVDQIKDILKL